MWVVRTEANNATMWIILAPEHYHAMMKRNNPFTVTKSFYLPDVEQALDLTNLLNSHR